MKIMSRTERIPEEALAIQDAIDRAATPTHEDRGSGAFRIIRDIVEIVPVDSVYPIPDPDIA